MNATLVTGGGGNAFDGLAGTLMNVLRTGNGDGSGAQLARALTDAAPTPAAVGPAEPPADEPRA
jgi:hypothetical protein